MAAALTNKVILVTGANRGIGKSITEAVLEHGADKVYAAVRSVASLASLQEVYGKRIVPLAVDLTQPETIQEAAKVADDVDIVINNAGVLQNATALAENAIETLSTEMTINVYGLMHMARAFAPILKRRGGGAFVQLNSVASMRAFEDFATYCASKAAAYSITQSLRSMLKAQGTQVISVHPGPIATDMADTAGISEIAEPPSLVANALIAALDGRTFHVFPDTMAKQIGAAYRGFAEGVIEADMG